VEKVVVRCLLSVLGVAPEAVLLGVQACVGQVVEAKGQNWLFTANELPEVKAIPEPSPFGKPADWCKQARAWREHMNRRLAGLNTLVAKAAVARSLAPEPVGGAKAAPDGARGSESVGDSRGKVRPCDRRAMWQYREATEQDRSLDTDRKVYDFLREHLDEDDERKLPRFATWAKYLRRARGATGTQKHTPGRAQATGKSVVRREDL
jgi:hypothetical protein